MAWYSSIGDDMLRIMTLFALSTLLYTHLLRFRVYVQNQPCRQLNVII